MFKKPGGRYLTTPRKYLSGPTFVGGVGGGGPTSPMTRMKGKQGIGMAWVSAGGQLQRGPGGMVGLRKVFRRKPTSLGGGHFLWGPPCLLGGGWSKQPLGDRPSPGGGGTRREPTFLRPPLLFLTGCFPGNVRPITPPPTPLPHQQSPYYTSWHRVQNFATEGVFKS